MDPDPLARLRRDYGEAGLSESDAGDDPYPLLGRWFDDAIAAGITEPNAMALATVGVDGRPSVRIVLCKGFDDRGLVFYTGYGSAKSRDLEVEPWCALALLWHDIGRQVRVEGPVRRLEAAESDGYFASRPRDSRLSAWASPQSEVVPDRDDLERRLAEVEQRFGGADDKHSGDQDVPRPDNWGGWLVEPRLVEFWQGRHGRLHDRIRFRADDGGWLRERLGP